MTLVNTIYFYDELIVLMLKIQWKMNFILQMGEVIFKIPKFNFSSNLALKDICKTLGMENAFEITADLTNLSDTKPLFISNIKQN